MAVEIAEDLKKEVFVLAYIINDTLNFLEPLGLMPEYLTGLNPAFKPTFIKVLNLLDKLMEENKK